MYIVIIAHYLFTVDPHYLFTVDPVYERALSGVN